LFRTFKTIFTTFGEIKMMISRKMRFLTVFVYIYGENSIFNDLYFVSKLVLSNYSYCKSIIEVFLRCNYRLNCCTDSRSRISHVIYLTVALTTGSTDLNKMRIKD